MHQNQMYQNSYFVVVSIRGSTQNVSLCSQLPDKSKLVRCAMKLDLVSLARLRAVRYKLVKL